ncbi:MAG: DUF58 domain-containing protein [Hyphomicrobiaceae bacterium]|nr:MAG: DUF58 domain-containing protein [Hyphomicrobiaceae bacterium]
MPELMVEASRVAQTVAHGLHGRRRAGPGETFWQFRHAEAGDPLSLIDWRRSASSDRLFLREREWEAAHTVWLWPDLSASMSFKSELSKQRKVDRALIVCFALAELLIQGGERVGLMGMLPPTASRKGVQRMAEAIVAAAREKVARLSLPPQITLSRFNAVVLIGDFLDPVPALAKRLSELAAPGVTGHLVQVLDPAEETLPYEGRAEFLAMEDDDRFLAQRTETLREEFKTRIAAHKSAVADAARRLEWTAIVHHTDRPAEETLLALHTRLSGQLDRFASSGIAAVRSRPSAASGGQQ